MRGGNTSQLFVSVFLAQPQEAAVCVWTADWLCCSEEMTLFSRVSRTITVFCRQKHTRVVEIYMEEALNSCSRAAPWHWFRYVDSTWVNIQTQEEEHLLGHSSSGQRHQLTLERRCWKQQAAIFGLRCEYGGGTQAGTLRFTGKNTTALNREEKRKRSNNLVIPCVAGVKGLLQTQHPFPCQAWFILRTRPPNRTWSLCSGECTAVFIGETERLRKHNFGKPTHQVKIHSQR